MVLKGKFSSQISSAVYLFQDYLEVNLLCTARVVENCCVDFWFCGMQLNVVSFRCTYTVLFVAFCCQSKLFSFCVSLELIHHIRMDIHTFWGRQSFFTKHLQDKRSVLIALKYRHGFLSDEKMPYTGAFLLISRCQFRAHDKIIIIFSKELKFVFQLAWWYMYTLMVSIHAPFLESILKILRLIWDHHFWLENISPICVSVVCSDVCTTSQPTLLMCPAVLCCCPVVGVMGRESKKLQESTQGNRCESGV